jgi:hypothetical protein
MNKYIAAAEFRTNWNPDDRRGARSSLLPRMRCSAGADAQRWRSSCGGERFI